MKEVLEQLLRAEEAGRREAATQEAAGARLVAEAEAQSRQIAERARDDLAHRLDALRADAGATTDAELRAVTRTSEEAIARCRAQVEQHRPEALRQLVARLLDELPASEARAGKDDRAGD